MPSDEAETFQMGSSRRFIALFWGAAALACFGSRPAFAQENQPPVAPQATQDQPHYWDCISPICTYVQPQGQNKPPQPYGGGTPLDVLLNTKLWTDAPEAKDFVKATRPPEETLKYQSTGGKDIARSKLKSSAELQEMQDELERAGAAADRAAGVRSHFHVEDKKVAKRLHASNLHESSSPSATPLGVTDAARAARQ
ncbi:MAG: hypothetical protein WAN31_09935 [Methylovirgula sp.]